eukprot:2470051-Amphidinium_carterae.1
MHSWCWLPGLVGRPPDSRQEWLGATYVLACLFLQLNHGQWLRADEEGQKQVTAVRRTCGTLDKVHHKSMQLFQEMAAKHNGTTFIVCDEHLKISKDPHIRRGALHVLRNRHTLVLALYILPLELPPPMDQKKKSTEEIGN